MGRKSNQAEQMVLFPNSDCYFYKEEVSVIFVIYNKHQNKDNAINLWRSPNILSDADVFMTISIRNYNIIINTKLSVIIK